MNFENKVAIVTGAGNGIGFEIGRQLADQGASVVINDIDPTAVHNALTQIQGQKGKCCGVVGDASELSCIEQMVQTAVSTYGRLNIAVANAGLSTFGKFLDFSVAKFRRLTAVNLEGTFFLAQYAARQMIAQGGGGRLLLMSSVTGQQYHPDLAAYGMSKAAIRMLAKSLGVELAREGITVNAIAPGATLTERTLADETYQSDWSRLTPTGRPATPEDIGHAALFLLSDLAGQISGQTLVVDGGWTAVSPPP